jgi:hypothetical protein
MSARRCSEVASSGAVGEPTERGSCDVSCPVGSLSILGAAKRLRVQDQNKNQGEDLCNS